MFSALSTGAYFQLAMLLLVVGFATSSWALITISSPPSTQQAVKSVAVSALAACFMGLGAFTGLLSCGVPV